MQTNLFLYIWSKMLSLSRNVLVELSKTTSSQKQFLGEGEVQHSERGLGAGVGQGQEGHCQRYFQFMLIHVE